MLLALNSAPWGGAEIGEVHRIGLARQLSSRGGALHCTLDGDRVRLWGRAVLYLEGMISI